MYGAPFNKLSDEGTKLRDVVITPVTRLEISSGPDSGFGCCACTLEFGFEKYFRAKVAFRVVSPAVVLVSVCSSVIRGVGRRDASILQFADGSAKWSSMNEREFEALLCCTEAICISSSEDFERLRVLLDV